jgi:octaprenyl-diphosphate synthase
MGVTSMPDGVTKVAAGAMTDYRPSSAAAATAPIARELEQVERVYLGTLASAQPHLRPLIDHLQHYRGKRLRPMLLLLSAKACGRVTPAHHVLGAVVEMIHTATLVHDDVLDHADVRRHVRTVNAGWGNKTSILLGDYLFTHAFHLTSTLGDARACELIGEATNRVCEGELRQNYEVGNLDLSESDYFDIIDGKTAALTGVCCRLGAMYAGATPDVVDGLAEYGRLLGRAFQVADDLLDLAGNESKAGKTLGTDLQQRKMTLPLIRLFDSVPAGEAAEIRSLLLAGDGRAVAAVRSALERTQALAYARRRAEEFAREAAARLDPLAESVSKSVLLALTSWAVGRDN